MNELYQIWSNTNKNLNENIKINEAILSKQFSNKIHLNLFQIPLRNILNLAIYLPFIYFLFSFSWKHIQEARFFIPAMILIIIATFSMFISLKNLIAYLKIKANQPIYQTQLKLEKLKLYEVVENRSLLFIIPLFGLAFIIVMAKYINNTDLYNIWGHTWMYYYLFGSLCISIILVYFLQLFPDKKLKQALKEIIQLKENNE